MDFHISHREKLIISADDFGISPLANTNILELVRIGKIDRVGIMAHGILEQEEIAQLLKYGVKLDIHLDILKEFHEDRRKRSSALLRVLEFCWLFVRGAITSRSVASDWKEQIEMFKKIIGKYPDGINSHEHVHFFPPFFKVALALKNTYEIPYIRFGQRSAQKYSSAVAKILHYLRLYNMRMCKKENTCLLSSGSLVSLDWIADIDTFLNSLPEGTIEIACHPEKLSEYNKVKEYF